MLLINWAVESQLKPLNPFKIETRYATSYIDGDLEPVYSVQTMNHLPLLRQKHWLVSGLSRKELSNLYHTAAFLGVGMVRSAETVCTLVPSLVYGEISATMLVRFWVSAMKAEATLNCTKERIESRTLVAAWWKEWRNPWRTRATMVVETRRGSPSGWTAQIGGGAAWFTHVSGVSSPSRSWGKSEPTAMMEGPKLRLP